jgi:hypothetical protein
MTGVVQYTSKNLESITEIVNRSMFYLMDKFGRYNLMVKMIPSKNRYEFNVPAKKEPLMFLLDIDFSRRAYKHDIWQYHTDRFFSATELSAEHECTYMSIEKGPGWERWCTHLITGMDEDTYRYHVAISFDDEHEAFLYKLTV